MELTSQFMTFGTWGLAIANIPQFFEVLKNKHDLRGYDPNASLLILGSLIFISISFMMMEMWLSLLAQVTPIITWGMVAYYSRQTKKKVIVKVTR